METGVLEINLGPNTINDSLSTLHSNIRGIHNTLDNITENLYCASLAYLTVKSLIVSNKYDIPYRKYRTNNGQGGEAINAFIM